MKLEQLRNDDSAVSPVIGVILMVAITVILAAVIATFVLGLGEQVSDTTPNANFQGEWNSSEEEIEEDHYDDGEYVVLTMTHTSGPTIEGDRLDIRGADENVTVRDGDLDGEIGAGDDINIVVDEEEFSDDITDAGEVIGSGDEIRLRWQNDDGDTATLRTFTAPRDFPTG